MSNILFEMEIRFCIIVVFIQYIDYFFEDVYQFDVYIFVFYIGKFDGGD